MVDAYIDCKHGRQEPTYPHPDNGGDTEGNLRRNRVSRADHARPEPTRRHRTVHAYACIKAISKKKEDIIDARRVDFVKGAGTRRDEEKAKEIFDMIVYVRRLRLQQVAFGGLRSCLVTRRHTSRRTTRRSSWPPCSPARSRTATSATSWCSISTTPDGFGVDVLPPDVNAARRIQRQRRQDRLRSNGR